MSRIQSTIDSLFEMVDVLEKQNHLMSEKLELVTMQEVPPAINSASMVKEAVPAAIPCEETESSPRTGMEARLKALAGRLQAVSMTHSDLTRRVDL